MPNEQFQVSPYQPLVLTLRDRRDLLAMEDELVEDVFRKYERFVTENFSVNPARWKHLKSKDDLHIYVKRTEPEQSLGAKLCGWLKPRRPQIACAGTATAPSKNPIMLSVGTFQGDLDDLMFGTVNPTTDVMHVKASYVRDYDDGAVLTTLIAPTVDDPFRSVTVKWFRINLPFSSTGLTRDRDFVCLEASGMLHFANGERVGYLMVHSISSPQARPLPNVIRAQHTVTGFFRQVAPNVIETFGFDTVEPGGRLFRPLVLSVCADSLLSATNWVKCGQMKKLTWNLQRRRAALQNMQAPLLRGDTCVGCGGGVVSGTLGGIGRGKCQLCLGALCIGCKERKTISFLSPDRKLLRHKTTFCANCIRSTSSSNAERAARDQANGYQAYNVF